MTEPQRAEPTRLGSFPALSGPVSDQQVGWIWALFFSGGLELRFNPIIQQALNLAQEGFAPKDRHHHWSYCHRMRMDDKTHLIPPVFLYFFPTRFRIYGQIQKCNGKREVVRICGIPFLTGMILYL